MRFRRWPNKRLYRSLKPADHCRWYAPFKKAASLFFCFWQPLTGSQSLFHAGTGLQRPGFHASQIVGRIAHAGQQSGGLGAAFPGGALDDHFFTGGEIGGDILGQTLQGNIDSALEVKETEGVGGTDIHQQDPLCLELQSLV